MAVTGLDITARAPFAGGRAFGAAGPYERIDGRLHFAVDPRDPANAGIVDVGRAPRDAQGRVRFTADYCTLQPQNPERSARRLLVDVPNRGRKLGMALFNRTSAGAEGSPAIDPGDGFLLERGWTLAWTGWQWDVPRTTGALTLDAPQALGEDGQPIAGHIMVQFQPNAPKRCHLLSDRGHLPYPAADIEQADAELYVREHPNALRVLIDRAAWRFAREAEGRAVPDSQYVWCDDGFEAGKIYIVVYRTAVCPVVGAGLLAVRDLGAFLRYGGDGVASPCHRPEHAYAFGVSQTSRFLRTFLHLGLNLDEQGRQVYDGVHLHVGGARVGEFNHRYAQPSASRLRSFGYAPPFAYDGASGEGGLLDRQRAVGGVPRIVDTDTSVEYWRGDCALLHIDPASGEDRALPPEVRLYQFAGCQHMPGALPPGMVSSEGTPVAFASNTADYGLLLRAALINLDRWVSAGVEPPASRYPQVGDGTAVPREEVVDAANRLLGASVAAEKLQFVYRLDLGDAAADGVGRYPAIEMDPQPVYVPATDSDGNERSGLKPPEVAVPLASHTGWNQRQASAGGVGQTVEMMGATLPFAMTAQHRRPGDTRPTIDERYRDGGDYLDGVRTYATALASEGYLLPEDVDAAVANAAQRWDWVLSLQV